MTRQAAVRALHRHYGTTCPLALMDILQQHGLVADECISPKSAATCDLLAAVEKATEKQP
jgi:hypothetical protein